jgi:hypothetical protein
VGDAEGLEAVMQDGIDQYEAIEILPLPSVFLCLFVTEESLIAVPLEICWVIAGLTFM